MEIRLNDVMIRRDGRDLFRVERLRLEPGCAVAVLGENGTGKTTFLRVLAGLSADFTGEVLYDGEPHGAYFSPGNRPSRVLLLQQNPVMFRMGVAANLVLGAPAAGLSREDALKRAGKVLESLRIGHLASRPAPRLSGGETRLAALARALLPEPEVLLLDEPLAGIDEDNRNRVETALRARGAEPGRTTLFSTHREEEALRLADRLYRILDGRLAEYHPVNVFRGESSRRDDGWFFRSGALEIEMTPPEGSPSMVHVPPGEIVLAEAAVATSARNRLQGTVVSIVLAGSDADVTLDCSGAALTARISLRSLRERGWGVGDRLIAAFKVHAVRPL
ncbi:MAG: ABC transporter ATP-binding protein [Acidobacteria bacterium]|nr:ABC transporter ATP-binding protein [Acidobacteriota bacterium]